MPLSKRLVIVGAGNFGREVWQWANDIPSELKTWEEIVFVNDDMSAIDKVVETGIQSPIIATISDYYPQENDVCVCAIAEPKGKLKVVEKLEMKNAVFINILHPTAVVGLGCKLGKGVILCPNAVVTVNVSIGNHVIVNIGTSIGHDAQIEDGVTFSAHCDITGYCKVEKGSFFGSGARMLPKSRVGEFAVVGAGSVVLKKVAPFRKVFGNPAYYVD